MNKSSSEPAPDNRSGREALGHGRVYGGVFSADTERGQLDCPSKALSTTSNGCVA